MISQAEAKIVAFDGLHLEHGPGIYCVNCWATATDWEENEAALSLHDAYNGYEEVGLWCDVCSEVIVEPEPTEENLDGRIEHFASREEGHE